MFASVLSQLRSLHVHKLMLPFYTLSLVLDAKFSFSYNLMTAHKQLKGKHQLKNTHVDQDKS